jgi:hypothetical protein
MVTLSLELNNINSAPTKLITLTKVTLIVCALFRLDIKKIFDSQMLQNIGCPNACF